MIPSHLDKTHGFYNGRNLYAGKCAHFPNTDNVMKRALITRAHALDNMRYRGRGQLAELPRFCYKDVIDLDYESSSLFMKIAFNLFTDVGWNKTKMTVFLLAMYLVWLVFG